MKINLGIGFVLLILLSACTQPSDQTRTLAEGGDAEAQFELGNMYKNGRGVRQDFEQAAQWYRRSAEQGYHKAQNDLAVFYGQGKGVTQSWPEARRWHLEAAEQGDVKSLNNLGFIYRDGLGVEEDFVMAYMWWTIAERLGYSKARKNQEEMTLRLSASEVVEAEHRATDWMGTHLN